MFRSLSDPIPAPAVTLELAGRAPPSSISTWICANSASARDSKSVYSTKLVRSSLQLQCNANIPCREVQPPCESISPTRSPRLTPTRPCSTPSRSSQVLPLGMSVHVSLSLSVSLTSPNPHPHSHPVLLSLAYFSLPAKSWCITSPLLLYQKVIEQVLGIYTALTKSLQTTAEVYPF